MENINSSEAHKVYNRDIVIISLQPWYYELGSNCKNIATELAKNNRILYINIPITRKTFYSKQKSKGIQDHCEIIKTKSPNLKKIDKTLWEYYPTSIIESINGIPTTSIFKILNIINNKRFANDILNAIIKLNFKNIILFNDNDIYNGFHLKEFLKPSIYIYYMRDFLQGFPYWSKHSKKLEPLLIKKADLVVTNSAFYADYCKSYNTHSYDIGQGCNISLFLRNDKITTPEEIKKLNCPIIGYIGAIDSLRLDEKIIEKIATNNKDWNIVMVGPEDGYFLNSSLHQLRNIHFLGRKNIELLPAFVNSFDVCINPQKINNITQGNYPLKVDEYLAMGKPIIASRTRAMKLFENHVYLADKPSDYPNLIKKALGENSAIKKAERINFAKSHNWQNCIFEMNNAINHFYNDKNN